MSVLSRSVRIFDELALADALAQVDVLRPLIGDRGLPGDLAPARAVVVADEDPGLGRQREDLLYRAVQSVAASPPGKSARAVPPSGVHRVSPTNAASPTT